MAFNRMPGGQRRRFFRNIKRSIVELEEESMGNGGGMGHYEAELEEATSE